MPCCHLQFKHLRKPYPYKWKCTQVAPERQRTIGDHIKRRRLELHLFQSDLAKFFGVDPMTIVNWENNHYPPAKRYMPRIIEWLGMAQTDLDR